MTIVAAGVHYLRPKAAKEEHGLPVPTEQEIATLTARLATTLGADVRVACAPILEDDEPQDLLPEEAVTVAKAVPKRVREFAAGRRLARQLLQTLGFPPGPLVCNPDRSPAWPRGAIGAITHTRSLCVVVAARGGPDESLGVDAEPLDDLKPELRSLVCTPAEARWLEARPETERGRLGTLLFSAKETLYKCQHPLTGTFLGFHQAEIDLMPEAGRFEARILHPVAARFGADPMEGALIETDRWILTAMRWPPGPSGSGRHRVGTQTSTC